jgi:hypothetical protein
MNDLGFSRTSAANECIYILNHTLCQMRTDSHGTKRTCRYGVNCSLCGYSTTSHCIDPWYTCRKVMFFHLDVSLVAKVQSKLKRKWSIELGFRFMELSQQLAVPTRTENMDTDHHIFHTARAFVKVNHYFASIALTFQPGDCACLNLDVV